MHWRLGLKDIKLLHMALKLQVELRSRARGTSTSRMTVNTEGALQDVLLRSEVQDRTSRSLDMLRFHVNTVLSLELYADAEFPNQQ